MPEQTNRLKVLITEGTSLSARQTLHVIGPRHTIDLLDPSPLCQGRFSKYVRRWYKSPNYASDPRAFLEFVAERLAAESYDVLLPTHEQVYLFSRVRDELTPHVGLALPDFAAMQRMQDKAEFARLLAELGLPYPQTDFVRTRDELLREWQFPCYVKVAHSTAGRGVHHVTSAHELREVADKLTAAGTLDGKTDTLVQQPAKGVLSTAQAVFQHGRIVGAHVFESRELGVGGMSTARVSAVHPVVIEHVAKFGAHLDWHGAVFLDYFFDHDTGRPEYIEANPRIGETVNAMLTGVNLGELLLRVSRGQPLDQQPPQTTSRPGVRTQSFFMILLSRALVGAGRRQLLAEIWRRRRGRGLYADSQDDLTRPSEDPWSVLPPLWVALQLLVWPGLSHRIVAKAIRDYSLPAATAQTIQELPEGTFTQFLTAARQRLAGPKSRA